MDVVAYHHVALRVSHLERSSRFYTEVFDGVLLWDEVVERGFIPKTITEDPNTSARVHYIQFPRGGGIELCFYEPAKPLPALNDLTALAMTHLCMWVDDVEEAVRRAVAPADGVSTASTPGATTTTPFSRIRTATRSSSSTSTSRPRLG